MKRRRLLANAIALFTVPFVGTERTKAQTPAHQFVPGLVDGGEITFTIGWSGDFAVVDDFTISAPRKSFTTKKLNILGSVD